MIQRLSSFDLLRRLERVAPPWLLQLVVGAGLAGLAVGVRAMIDRFALGVAPFALLFPAMLIATGLAGWPAGLAAMAAGGLLSAHFFLAPHALRHNEVAALLLYGLSGGLVIAAAAAYRRTALALRDSEERLELATASAKVGVWDWRLATGEVIYSAEARRIYGFSPDQAVTWDMLLAATHPDDVAVTEVQAQRALDDRVRDDLPHERRIIRTNGEVRWVVAMGRPVLESTASGPVATRYVGVIQDITARKADEERLRLLAREVDHRANNLLAVVQGMVALSHADDVGALRAVISGRVDALARAHQLLAKARWEGADLRRLVEEELLAFSLGDEGRTAIEGPPVALAPAAAQAVAMALHELATNAAKYGALSTSSGRVEVLWSLDAVGGLHLSWRESGGPPVRKPTRRGLGATVLSRALSGPLGGETRLDWRAEGLVCEMLLPASGRALTEARDSAMLAF